MTLPNTHKFEIGQRLRSARIGVREAFDGEVVFVAPSNKYVHLRDSNGKDWHRDRFDLSFITRAEKEQAA